MTLATLKSNMTINNFIEWNVDDRVAKIVETTCLRIEECPPCIASFVATDLVA